MKNKHVYATILTKINCSKVQASERISAALKMLK